MKIFEKKRLAARVGFPTWIPIQVRPDFRAEVLEKRFRPAHGGGEWQVALCRVTSRRGRESLAITVSDAPRRPHRQG